MAASGAIGTARERTNAQVEPLILIEVFPKLLVDVVRDAIGDRDCGSRCACNGPAYGYIMECNQHLIATAEELAEELGFARVHVHRYDSQSEYEASLQRLSDLLQTRGFAALDAGEEGMQMMELATPAVAFGGTLCGFATFPTRDQLIGYLCAMQRTPRDSEP